MAASDPLLTAFRTESDQLIAERWSRAALAVLSALSASSLLAFLLGEHASLWSWASFTVAQAGVGLALAAARPWLRRMGWQRPAALLAAVLLVALLHAGLFAAFCPRELAVLLAVLAVVGAPLVFPWGPHAQAVFATASGLAALALALATAGATADATLALTAVAAAGGISVLCARQLELHRFAIFCEAMRQEGDATLERRLLTAIERVDVSLHDAAALDLIATAARDALGREWALLLHCDERRGVARIVGGCGHSDLEIDSLRSLELTADEMPLLAEIARRGQLEIGSLSTSQIAIPPLLKRWRCASLLGAALSRDGAVIGTLLVGAGRRARLLDNEGRRLFAEIARRTATALGNVRLLAELREAGTRKSEFLATVSHELRSPLDVIIGYADMLGDEGFGLLNEAQRDMLERLRLQSLNLAQFTAATLETQRLETEDVGEPLRWIDLQTLVFEMQRDARALPRRGGIELEWDVAAKPLRLFTDPHKVRVVVKNLVGNALKFTDAGRVVARIHVDETRQKLEIAVRDTGRGIDKAELPSVFEMFRQGSNCAEDPTLSGVGLGLYIVKSFAEQLDGTVSAHSEVGRGSIFRVSLPLRADDSSPAARAAAQLVA